MRIVFMGTPDFAVQALQNLIDSPHEVVAVYTQPDRPSGRGNKITMSPVKKLALEHGLPVYQPERIKTAEAIAQIVAMRPDVLVVVAYGQLLSKEILDIPPHGCLNIHGSILPKYRGAAPIHWAVLNGDTSTGVTIMRMDTGMDTGDILSVAHTEILPEDTTASLYEKLKVQGAELLLEVLSGLEANTITPVKQDDDLASYTKMITRDMERIEWTKTAVQIHNQIRALNGSFTLDDNDAPLKVWETKVVENISGTPGTVVHVDKIGFVVATGANSLRLLEIQPANRKRMAAADYANGKQLKVGMSFR